MALLSHAMLHANPSDRRARALMPAAICKLVCLKHGTDFP